MHLHEGRGYFHAFAVKAIANSLLIGLERGEAVSEIKSRIELVLRNDEGML